jgi:hypothetical protein
MGYVYNADGKLIIDPDQQVQQSVRVLFETFRRTGSAMATVKFFAEQGLQFPRRVHTGANKGDTVWAVLEQFHKLRTDRAPAHISHDVAPLAHDGELPLFGNGMKSLH